MAIKKIGAEIHLMNRIGWLRAAVLGANDGILSTASIVSGMAAGGAGMLKPTLRILLWGSISLGLTTLVGVWFGVKP